MLNNPCALKFFKDAYRFEDEMPFWYKIVKYILLTFIKTAGTSSVCEVQPHISHSFTTTVNLIVSLHEPADVQVVTAILSTCTIVLY